ncbi:MAG TPA: hypothetical protein VFY26_05055 [Anaerolineales bacterium]|nr:hypothetical protein [Anaerolineales bacterium]
MRKFYLILILLFSILLAGCKASPAPAPVDEAAVEPSPVPAPSTVEEVDYCVSCHTDKEQLISTAKPVLAAESESRGVG